MTKAVRQLTKLFTPSAYSLHLNLTKRVEREFSGLVTITGAVAAESTEIVLHSKELTIIGATINSQEATWEQKDNDELALRIPTALLAGEYIVRVAFTGKITDPMHGLYPCYFTHDGKKKELLATQLESHYAREVFPCVDEPAGKATFDLSLTTETGIVVIGNTPVASSDEDESGLVTVFETTPKMSPYLLAFVTGELKYLETTNKNGVLVRAYSVPDKEEQTRFALDYAAKTLEFYDDYFAVPYPLPKLDLVALPDFSSAAMENWGLVTFREAYMLVDEANTPADLKETIATVVTHELAHQWFGNLVTMKWWDDLWLNESFAKWMENYSADHLNPEWRVWEQFGASEQPYALSRDSLANVQAVREPVNHPEELNSLFDPAIVYAKGGCLIRMLQNYLGDDIFRDGLRIYMKRHQYNNAEADDLWAALDEVSRKDVKGFMHRWLTQPGHPVVTANLNGTTLSLTQRRFFANPAQAQDTQTSWPLPLLSAELTGDLLDVPTSTYTVSSTPVMLNKNHTGFYHTQYDSSMLEAIARLVPTGNLSAVDRQGLLTDSLALARAGMQPLTDVVKLLANYSQEESYPVWLAMSSINGALRTIINDDPEIKPYLQRYTAKLAQTQFERLGWKRIPGEPYFDELLRPTVISLLAYAEVPSVVSEALAQFDAAKVPEDITMPEIRAIVYGVAVREYGEKAFDKVLGWYKTTQSADERVTLVAGLSTLRDPKLGDLAMKLLISEYVRPQDVSYWFIYFLRNRFSRKAAWQWMQDNWDWITTQFKNSHDYSDFPKYAASAFATREEFEGYKRVFEPMLNQQDLAMVIRQGIEEIDVRATWRERDLASVTELLKSFK